MQICPTRLHPGVPMISRWGWESWAVLLDRLFVGSSNCLGSSWHSGTWEMLSDAPNQQTDPRRFLLRACQLNFSIGMPRKWNILWHCWCQGIKKWKSCLWSSYVSVRQCRCYNKKITDPKLSILAILFIKLNNIDYFAWRASFKHLQHAWAKWPLGILCHSPYLNSVSCSFFHWC